MNGLTEGAYWEELTDDTVPVPEPDKTFRFRATTIPEEEHDHIP